MKPIDLKTWEVRALLVGRKTAALRAMKPQPESAYRVFDHHEDTRTFEFLRGKRLGGILCEHITNYKAPYWPGDILYVRETWTVWNGNYEYKADVDDGYGPFCSSCTLDICAGDCNSALKWHPSIHMPREAARIFLRVTDVRPQRLQDITEAQAKANGCGTFEEKIAGAPLEAFDLAAKAALKEIWDAALKPKDRGIYGWAANPWVWAIGFERTSEKEAKHESD